jgi:DNA-binding transcriptional MerR regulator
VNVVEQWYLPAEMARRLGVSPKALRVYERAGLVSPLRTAAGWRAYGPVQAARLHQILALKSLGLSLKRIGELLAGRLASLDAVLAVQQGALELQQTETRQALALLAAARARLAEHGALSADDLTQLTKETVMNDKLRTDAEWKEAFEPLIEKHYAQAEIAALGARKLEAYKRAGYDQESFRLAWEGLFEEARALKAAGDVDSPRACELVRRWNEMTGHFTQGDPIIGQKAQAVWSEATADPKLAPRLPVSPDEFAFVQKIADGMRARGELPPRIT